MVDGCFLPRLRTNFQAIEQLAEMGFAQFNQEFFRHVSADTPGQVRGFAQALSRFAI
jgi:hypothetical protein